MSKKKIDKVFSDKDWDHFNELNAKIHYNESYDKLDSEQKRHVMLETKENFKYIIRLKINIKKPKEVNKQ